MSLFIGKRSNSRFRNFLKGFLLSLGLMLATVSHGYDKITYYHLDALGSPVAVTDQSGTVVWREDYRPYGERIQKQPQASTNTRWYTGHPHEEITGLTYMGARWYDPTVGRFMGVDPKDFTEKDQYRFNRYSYANNNPYQYIDPDGRDAISIGVSANILEVGKNLLGPLGGFLSGGAGIVISVPGFTGGEFDIGVYHTGQGGYGFAPDLKMKGLGKVAVDVTAAGGSVLDMEGESKQNSFTAGPGGLHWGYGKDGGIESVGIHGGGGAEISSGGAKTEVYSARRGISKAVEHATNELIGAGKRAISRKTDEFLGPSPPNFK